MSDFWVFGYGSLMWRPGFQYAAAVPARLSGAHRALCIYSWVHRGTRARPGLVLGLDRGGSCRGLAFRVESSRRDPVMAYLRERELVTDVYREVWRPVALADGSGRSVAAVTYVADRTHEQYAGALSRERLLEMVATAEGRSGRNDEYVVNTARHLSAAGIHDDVLEWLAAELGGESRRESRG
ncbi:MAG TPA: gamma-glutamylcyclotransferase [Bauldia sp.]|nr:gamma-glutamylcyclotransferase [Bauldia sp.]